MITKTQGYKSSDGAVHLSLDSAQQRQLLLLMGYPDGGTVDWKMVAELIVANRTQVLDILTTTATSRPRARKLNGATRKPRSKAELVEKQKMVDAFNLAAKAAAEHRAARQQAASPESTKVAIKQMHEAADNAAPTAA